MKTYSRKKSGETQDVILDLNELCRLCMAKEDELVPIFNNDDPIPLTLRIMACVALEVFEGDGLPNKICHPCKFQLEKSYNFRKKCESSDMKLRQHLKSIQAKIGDVDLAINEDSERMDVESGEQADKRNDGEAEEPSTEEDLVGVAQVAYIQPDPDPEDDPESITLPPETELINKDACTLKSMKREVIDVEEPEGEGVVFVDEGNQEMEDTSYDAIADAVKATLATQPDLIKKEPITEFGITQPENAEITKRRKSIPTKSSYFYQAAYQKYIKWCEENRANNYSENELLAYFNELAAKRNMKSSTLWTHYSMLKSLLNINHGVDIAQYSRLRGYLKKTRELYVPKKAISFTKEQLEKFVTEAPDKKYLAMKVILIIGGWGACLVEELVRIKIGDIEDRGSLLYIKIRDNTTNKTRSFKVVGENFINTYRKYASLRPTQMDNRRFFLKYENGRCHRLVMGAHKIGGVPREVASYLKLPNWQNYSGHCLRRTSFSQQLDRLASLERDRDWKCSSESEDVAEDCKEEAFSIEECMTVKEEFVAEDWSPDIKCEVSTE